MTKYISSSIIVVVAFYAIFAGLLAITSVLEWTKWDEIGDWLAKGALVALIFLVLNAIVAFLTTLISRPSDTTAARKK